MNKTFKDLMDGLRLYPVWLHQAYHSLVVKYKRTILGTLWIAGNFVFTSLAITLVFGTLFHQDLKTFLPYSMLGNLVGTTCLWMISEAPDMFIYSGGIIKNHAYPFTYFAFESVARVLMLLAHNFIVFYFFMLVNGTLCVPHWTFIPGLILITISMLTWGSLLGMFAARFRDLRFLLPNIANLLFFLTPIYWRVDMLGPKEWIAELNPIYNLVSILRQPLLGLQATSGNWLYAIGIAATGTILWLIFFTIYRRRIPFWV
jgi:ABC-type polysaccharide/polyol phosphate export permease